MPLIHKDERLALKVKIALLLESSIDYHATQSGDSELLSLALKKHVAPFAKID